MTKYLYLFFISISFSTFSQSYFHKFGFNRSLLKREYEETQISITQGNITRTHTEKKETFGFKYQAGINFKLAENINISPTIYPYLGIGGQGENDWSVNTFFILELPILVELYIGDREETGGFLGFGYMISHSRPNTQYHVRTGTRLPYFGPLNVRGFQVSGGIHLSFDEETKFGEMMTNLLLNNISLRVSYTIPSNAPKKHLGYDYTKDEFINILKLSLLWDI